MRSSRRWHVLFAGSLGLLLAALTGCQTWVPDVGQTLPTPHYLQHFPQYTAPSPPYPLPNELDGVTRANLRAAQFAPAGGPPPAVAPGGFGVPPMPPVGPVGPGPMGPGMPPVPGPGMPGMPGMP